MEYSSTNVLYLGTETVVAVIVEVSFIIKINTDLRFKNTYIPFLELQIVSGAVSLPRFR